ncbi:MAG: hypothetical protein ACYSTT_19320 [Planctomycetota bacterium]
MQSSTDLGAFYTDMINTLRITSVVAAILAGVFFVFPVIYGVRSDEGIEEFLKLPSAKEKFEKAADTKTKTSENRESPLVKQAEAFALYLNPVKSPVKRITRSGKTTSISDKVTVTPKFPVLATIVYPENPNLSQALINEPGKGRHWVRQSSKVGHLFLEQVEDGLVVLKSGDETYEIKIAEEAETGSPGKPSAGSSLRSSPSSAKPASTAFSRASANVRRTRNVPQRTPKSSIEKEKTDQFVNELKELRQSSASGKTDSKIDPEERNARIQELISKYKSIRVSPEESEKLDNMGEELKGIKQDPNASPAKTDKDEEQPSPPKSDKPAKK